MVYATATTTSGFNFLEAYQVTAGRRCTTVVVSTVEMRQGNLHGGMLAKSGHFIVESHAIYMHGRKDLVDFRSVIAEATRRPATVTA